MKKLSHLLVVLFVFGAAVIFNPAVARDAPATAKNNSIPKAPDGFKVAAVSLFQINLSWSDKSANEDGFKIERSTDGKYFAQIAQLLPGTTTYRDTRLFPDSSYSYRVRAFNAAGNSGYTKDLRARTLHARPLVIAEWGDVTGAPLRESNWVAVAAGTAHGLALKSNGTVTGWGHFNNDYYSQETTPPTNLTGVIAIAAGNAHSLALKADGTVVGWGLYEWEASPPTNLTGVVAIAAGDSHSLALKNDGTVVGWGYYYYGAATPPTNLTGVVAIACGDVYSLALKSDGTVVGWGTSYSGQTTIPSNLNQVVAIAAGWNQSLALKSDGTVVGWGYDTGGQASVPTNLIQVVAIAVAGNRSLALKSNGDVISWGYNGNGDAVPPTNLAGVVAISAYAQHGLALTTEPAPPSEVRAKIISANQINLSWRDNSTSESGFKIERALDDGFFNPGTWTQIAVLQAGKTSYSDFSVATNATYWYRVRAFNHTGSSIYSPLIIVSTAPPTAPQWLSGNLNITNGVDLGWYDSFSGVDGFTIQRAPDTDGSPGTWSTITSLTATNSGNAFFRDLTVGKNMTYWYRVRASNVLGNSPSSDPTAVAVIPPVVPYFNASPFADKASLYWYGYGPSSGFKIERAPDIGGNPGTWLEITNFGTDVGNFTDAGLSANTTYWYRARAYNWVGDSDYSIPVSVNILPPTAPNSVAAGIGLANNVEVSWNENPDDQDGFKLERAPDAGGSPGTWTEIASLNISGTTSTSYNDTNVVGNNLYWYRVRAFNALGLSDYSATASVNLAPPAAPTSVNATSLADRVNLSWHASSGGPLGFKIERALDADGTPGAWTQIATFNPSSYFSTSYADTNRTADTTYWYRVRAFNWIGDSPYSSPTIVTIVPPAMPTYFTASLGDTNQVNLSWSDNAGDEDGFTVEEAPDLGGGPGLWTQIAVINSGNTYYSSYQDINVTANITNWYRVRAFNVVGVSGYTDPVSVRIIPPDAPYNLNASAFKDTINTYWNENYNGLIGGFKIERAPDLGGSPGAWTAIATNIGFNTSYNDPGRAANSLYWYRVRAFNWIGDSSYSPSASAMIVPPGMPYNLSAAIGLTNQVNLSWGDYSTDEDGFKLERAPDAGGNPGVWAEIASINATNFDFVSYMDTNVTANTTNWYRVRAFNVIGLSPYSDPATSVALVPPLAPNLSGYPFINQVNLSWYATDYYPYYPAGITGFKLQRAPNAGGGPGMWTEITNTPDTSYSDANLTANASYWYRICAYNWIGDSPFSDPVNVTIVPPATPNYLSGTIGTTNEVNLVWLEYSGDEGGFKIERAPDFGGHPGAWAEIASFDTNSYYNYFYFTDTNVTANTTNWYRVRAFNIVGISDYGNPASVSVIPPDAPAYLSAYAFKDSINTSWSGDYNGQIGGFKIERAPDTSGSPGTWISIATNIGYNTSYSDSGRVANTTNWYRVRAFNWVGDSGYSSLASAMVVPPLTPNSVYGTIGTTNQINLSWYDPSSDEDGFNLERAPNVGGNPGAWTEIATINTTNYYSASYADTNVTANTTNWYRVRAFNVLGVSDYSPTSSVSIVPPGVPSLSGVFIATHHIHLSWYEDDYNFNGRYEVERAPDAGGVPGTWTQIATQSPGYYSGSYDDFAVTTNKTYWYRVQASNWVGSSPYSDAIAVNDAAPAAPVSLTAINDAANQITVDWTSPPTNAGGFQIERAVDLNGAPASWIKITSVGSATTSFTDTNLIAGKTYWYRVRAFNDVGNSPYSNEARAQVRVGQFVRVMQWNIEKGLGRIENNYYSQAQAIARIVNYNQPDVLLFCEVDAQNLTAAQNQAAIINWVTNNVPYLGTQPGVTFFVSVSSKSDGFIRNAAVSRYPIAGETTFDDGLRGLHSFQVKLSDANSLQVFHTHLKCCSDDCARKQIEAQFDAGIISAFALTNSLPYIFAGDWNEDEQNSECTISSTYNPIKTIREGGNFVEFKPTTLSGEYRTWSSQNTSPSIRFDYILAATNRLAPVSGEVFSTMDWQNHGIYGNFDFYDSYYASDHYCVFANYFFSTPDLIVTPPDALASSGFQGGPFAPTNQTYTLSNSAAAPVNWTIGKSAVWLTISADTGTLASGASTNITVALNASAAGLAANVYSDAITFSNATAGIIEATRPVRLTVNDPALLAVRPPASLSSLGLIGGPFNPGQQTYSLSNAGIATLAWTASDTAGWVTFSATSGTLAAGAATNIVVSINASANGLAAANYLDTLTFANTMSSTGSTTRFVNLTVTDFGFYDDFGMFSAGNLVGQKAWAQALASASLPLKINGGGLIIPSPQSGDNQDAFKNFTITSTTLFYGMTLVISNAPSAASPSYFAALYTDNNATGFANYRLTARDNGGGTFVLGARITGQSGDPYTFGTVGIPYGTLHRVIVEADSGGTVMKIFVDPPSPDLADQTAYLIHGIASGTPATQVGSFTFSQFNSGNAPILGLTVGRIVLIDNFTTAYYDLTNPSAPVNPPTNAVGLMQIISAVPTNENILITWLASGGTTNAVQAAPTAVGIYTDISPNILIAGTGGAVTNYLDAGALTNASSRFYRIRQAP